MCDPASVSRYLYRLYEYGAEHGTVDHGEAGCLSHLQVKTTSWLGTTIAVNPSRGPRETNQGAEVHCDAACEEGSKTISASQRQHGFTACLSLSLIFIGSDLRCLKSLLEQLAMSKYL